MKNQRCLSLQVALSLGVLALLSILQLLNAYASGVLYVALTGNDANNCLTMASACRTIPAAVGKASSGDTIIIAAGTYTESIAINKDLTLIGFGADATIIDQAQVFVSHSKVNIFDMALTHGSGGSYGDGGALYNDGGDLTVESSSILSSTASNGGGVFNYGGSLIIEHSLIANNASSADGGGLWIGGGGVVSISHSTIMGNTTCNRACPFALHPSSTPKTPANGFLSRGGGIYIETGSIAIETSAIFSNSAFSGGDGITNYGSLVITNSTISNNGGFGSFGSGLWNHSPAILTNVTLDGNQNSGLRNYGVAAMRNTIIANTSSGSNCVGSNIVSLGNNLSSDGSCNLNAGGDLTNTNPLLGPLQNNGGSTPTQALLPGSPAINGGTNAGCPTTDQRGIPRPQAGICDIGAYEYVFPYSMYLPLVMR